MGEKKYQVRYAAGGYWLLDMSQDGLNYQPPMSLNETGMYIYTRICDKKSALEIANDMHNDFGISVAEAQKDVEEFIEIMIKRRVLNRKV